MFHWICPECGREIAPTIRECPACDPVAATVETAPAGEVEASARAGKEAAAPAMSAKLPGGRNPARSQAVPANCAGRAGDNSDRAGHHRARHYRPRPCRSRHYRTRKNRSRPNRSRPDRSGPDSASRASGAHSIRVTVGSPEFAQRRQERCQRGRAVAAIRRSVRRRRSVGSFVLDGGLDAGAESARAAAVAGRTAASDARGVQRACVVAGFYRGIAAGPRRTSYPIDAEAAGVKQLRSHRC